MQDRDRHRRRDRARARARQGGRRRACRRCWALAEEIQLPASIRQTLPWTVTRTPDAVPALFGLRDLMWLGKPELSQETLDRWGVFAEVLDNRLQDRDAAGPRPGKTSAAVPTAAWSRRRRRTWCFAWRKKPPGSNCLRNSSRDC